MKGKQRSVRLIASVSALAISVGLCAAFPATAARAEETAGGSSLIGALSYTYADYIKDCEKNGATAYTGEDVVFGPDSAVSDSTVFCEQDGVRAAASGEAHRRLTFRVTAPQDGLYRVAVKYIFPDATGFNGSRKLLIDGDSVCLESDNLAFTREFRDDGEPRTNAMGDQVKPATKELLSWKTVSLIDNMGRSTDPLSFYLTAGEHELTFVYDKQELLIAEVVLCAPETHIPYDEYIRGAAADITGFHERVQAEEALLSRNDPAVGLTDDGDPCVVPSKPGYLLMNTVGGYTYREGGQSVTFRVTVEKAGYYCLNFRSKQTWSVRMNSFRKIEINGKVPFAEAACVAFPYHTGWQNVTPGRDGEPYRFYLEAGENLITLTAVLGPNTETLRLLEDALGRLSAVSRKITMIIGTDPDPNYDYDLENTIPGLKDALQEIIDLIDEATVRCNAQNGGKDTMTGNSLDTNAKMLREMRDRTEQIPKRTADLNNVISSLGSCISSLQEQALQLDHIDVFSSDVVIEDYRSGFFARCKATFESLFVSFYKDYSSVSAAGESGKTLDVWVGRGREWAEIMKELLDTDFTAKTGIEIRLNVVPSGGLSSSGTANLLLLSITAGTQPDLALGVGSDMPVEYAIRDVAVDLSELEGYQEVISRFPQNIMIPFEYEGGCYGLPETIGFRGMFYRTDILEELGLEVPSDWDEVFDRLLPALNENGMQFYLPNWLDYFILSCGGTYYKTDSEGHLCSALDSPEVYRAFKMLTDAYVVHGLPTAASFFNRFRTGEMPIGLADNSIYLQLVAAAPELNGKWAMAPLPGIRQEDGSVSRRYPSIAGSAAVILKASKKQEEAWALLRQWLSEETQTSYSREVESRIGKSARWMSSVSAAFSSLPWEKDVIDTVKGSWKELSGVPNVLGGYYVGRHINNAWNRVVINGMLPRESLERAVADINKELARKREQVKGS